MTGTDGEDPRRLLRLVWLLAGVGVLWFLARSRHVETWMNRVMKKFLNRWTQLKVFDYTALLHLSGEYSVQELQEKKYEEKRRKQNR